MFTDMVLGLLKSYFIPCWWLYWTICSWMDFWSGSVSPLHSGSA